MPVTLTTIPEKTPVPFAKTKEFQDLQSAINNAKQSLDDVARAVVAIEAKMNPPQADYAPAVNPYNNQGDLNEMLRIAGLRN
jgi:hypothetical protein